MVIGSVAIVAPAPRARAMGLDVIDVDEQGLRVRAIELLRALAPPALAVTVTDHHHGTAEDQLGVLDAASFTFDLELELEAECATQEVDRLRRFLIGERCGHSRPALGWIRHWVAHLQ